MELKLPSDENENSAFASCLFLMKIKMLSLLLKDVVQIL